MGAYSSRWQRLPPEVIALIAEFLFPGRSALVAMAAAPLRPPPLGIGARFRICARKRPVWERELGDDGEFDSLTVNPATRQCVVHDARLDRGTFTRPCAEYLRILPRGTASTRSTSSSTRARRTTTCTSAPRAPARARALGEGLHGTLVLFGQTGTGKTHTCFGVQQRLARDVFAGLRAGEGEVALEAFELRGTRVCDLLAERRAVKVLQDAGGAVRVAGARRVVARDANRAARALATRTRCARPRRPSATSSRRARTRCAASRSRAVRVRRRDGRRRRRRARRRSRSSTSRARGATRTRRCTTARRASSRPRSTRG